MLQPRKENKNQMESKSKMPYTSNKNSMELSSSQYDNKLQNKKSNILHKGCKNKTVDAAKSDNFRQNSKKLTLIGSNTHIFPVAY